MADDNWDLQAVVRGYRGVKPTATVNFNSEGNQFLSPPPPPPPLLIHDDCVITEENLISSYQDLHDLCKPFQLNNQKRNLVLLQHPPPPPPPPLLSLTHHSKKRKNQMKKIVCLPTNGGHPDDLWAWRKYGQKPIKGSPFPRGYYRCSSSKNCLARKQVERSRTDSGVLVVTYTGDHNHPVPTHRNSLAGSTRPKPTSSSSSTTTTGNSCKQVHPAAVTASSELSPTTPLTSMQENDYCFCY